MKCPNAKFKQMKKKIHVDELMEKATDWWDNQFDDFRTTIILKEYMNAKDIKEEDVEW
jgi:hypothetical protein